MSRHAILLSLVFTSLVMSGCNWGSTDEAEKEEFVLGNLIEPFDPPTLEELDAQAEWVDMPVLDATEMLRERLAGEPPLATVKEALALKNDSDEANEKILSALGRLPASDDEVDWNATLVRHTGGELKSTNPLFASSVTEGDVLSLTGYGLMSFDWNLRPFASTDTVISWQSSKDKMFDKIILRDDLTWSDGTPITAHDVEFSFKVVMSEKVPVISRTAEEKMKGVKAYDDHTLVFFHKEPLVTNIWNVNTQVLPKHVYEKSIYEDPTLMESDYHVAQENKPVVGGSYVIKERIHGQHTKLARRESYYMHKGKKVRDMPYFKEITFKPIPDSNTALLALKSGDIEEMELTPEQWKSQTTSSDFYTRNTKARGLEWTSFHFNWNNTSPFFSDKRVRIAMSYAFDHKEMLQNLRLGLNEPCNGTFHFTSQWAAKGDDAPKSYTQDLDKAEALLEEAGWIDHDGDGFLDKKMDGRLVPFEFTILSSNRPDRIAVCNLLKQNLGDIGITCHVKSLEFAVMQEAMFEKKYQAAFAGWGTGADPYTLKNIFGTTGERNYGSYSNPEIDRLFIEGMREFDTEKREKVYQQIHKILYDDQPYTWLFFRSSFYGFNKDLRGYIFSPRGPYSYSPGFGGIHKPAMN